MLAIRDSWLGSTRWMTRNESPPLPSMIPTDENQAAFRGLSSNRGQRRCPKSTEVKIPSPRLQLLTVLVPGDMEYQRRCFTSLLCLVLS
jgi:hypothetical protein